jgi:hypothetical protein
MTAMRSLFLLCLSSCLVAYVRQMVLPASQSLWQQVANNHRGRREIAIKHIEKLERIRTILGVVLLVQVIVVATATIILVTR